MTSVPLQLQQLQLFCEGFSQGLGVIMGIFDHSSRSSFVRSQTDVGQEGLALSLHSNSSQRCSIRMRSGLCAHQSSSSTPNSLLMSLWTCFVHWCTVMLEQEGPSPNCSHRAVSWNCAASLGVLKHSELLSLELRDQAQLLKNNPTP